MGVLDEAIRAHLELKRKHGASDEEVAKQESEALGPARRERPPEPAPHPPAAPEESAPELPAAAIDDAVAQPDERFSQELEEAHPSLEEFDATQAYEQAGPATPLSDEPPLEEHPALDEHPHEPGIYSVGEEAPARHSPAPEPPAAEPVEPLTHPPEPVEPLTHAAEPVEDALVEPAADDHEPAADHHEPAAEDALVEPEPVLRDEPPAADDFELAAPPDEPPSAVEPLAHDPHPTDLGAHDPLYEPPPAEPPPAGDLATEEPHADPLLEHPTMPHPAPGPEETVTDEGASTGTPPRGFPAVEAEEDDAAPEEEEDVLEETPDFLQETPEHDRLWFEQKPPRDFDFDD